MGQPQPVYTNPPVAGQPQYYNQIPQYPPAYSNMQAYPQQFTGQPFQNQPYGVPPNTGIQPQYGLPQPYVNSMYNSPFRQPQYNPQQQQPPIPPSETIQYQRLVERLVSYLQSLPGQPEVKQQYYDFKLWSAPQQLAGNQPGVLQQSSSDNTQPSSSITIPDSFVKGVIQSLPPIGVADKTYLPPLVHVPPGVVLVAPAHYIAPVPNTPDVSLYRSHLQYGFPILIHDNGQ